MATPKSNAAKARTKSTASTKGATSNPKGGSKVKEKKATAAKETTTKATTPKEEVTVTKTNGQSNGKRIVKLADMPTVKLTKKQFGELTPDQLVDNLIDPKNPTVNRISRERAKAMLIKRIEAGNITVTPAFLMYTTYKEVVVKGASVDGFRGTTKPHVTLTKEEFSKLTPKGIAEYVDKFTHKRRAADKVIPQLVKMGMPMTAEDVVHITNGRVAIEGVVVKSQTQQETVPVEGVSFS